MAEVKKKDQESSNSSLDMVLCLLADRVVAGRLDQKSAAACCCWCLDQAQSDKLQSVRLGQDLVKHCGSAAIVQRQMPVKTQASLCSTCWEAYQLMIRTANTACTTRPLGGEGMR